MAGGKVCGICRTGYRTWAEHASSEGHRAKAYRHANPQVRGKQHKRLARDAAYRRSRWEERDPDDPRESGKTVRVHAYKRGRRPVVRVTRHRRRPPLYELTRLPSGRYERRRVNRAG